MVSVVKKSGSKSLDIQIIRLPQPAHHALQGMIHLARRPDGMACLALDVARARRLPSGALAKTFQLLAHRGLLTAQRGPGGGYRLARSAQSITAAEIVDAAVDSKRAPACLMQSRSCDRTHPCAMHDAAVQADLIVRKRLESVTLADLCAMEGKP